MLLTTRWRALPCCCLCLFFFWAFLRPDDTGSRRLSALRMPQHIDLFKGRSLADVLAPCASVVPRRSPPTSVRMLHPGDVRIVAAIGDSITAAFAAYEGIPVEYRGLSYAIGGADNHATLPNILRHYLGNFTLQGPSTGWTNPLKDAADIFPGQHAPLLPMDASVAHLNAAISNGIAADGPRQVEYLAKVMDTYERAGLVSVKNDWKLITVLLGANDLLGVCRGHKAVQDVGPKWRSMMNNTLALLKQRFPRTFVALLAVPDVGEMGRFKDSTMECALIHKTVEKSDFCPMGGETDAVQAAMNKALSELQEYWSDKVQAVDFAVVLQPFSQRMNLPNVSFLSKLDCFHPGEHGHAEASVSLWNSLVTPRSQKRNSTDVGAPAICANSSTLLHVD